MSESSLIISIEMINNGESGAKVTGAGCNRGNMSIKLKDLALLLIV